MKLKLAIAFMILFIIGAFVSYFLAKKHQNKKILIATYILLGLTLISLIFIMLDLIIVGGI